jgi:hypothetical protein
MFGKFGLRVADLAHRRPEPAELFGHRETQVTPLPHSREVLDREAVFSVVL